MPPQPNLDDIAKQAGVSKCTVSYALRNSPRASRATRQRIQSIAREMGYQPNALSALHMANIRRSRNGSLQPAIGYQINYAAGDPSPHYRRLLHGMQEHAESLGFVVSPFNLAAERLSPKRFQQILHSRHIHGLILSPLPVERLGESLEIDWKSFAAAAVGFSVESPALHRAANFQFHSIRLAYQKLRLYGHRRIALATDPLLNQKFDFQRRGSFRECLQQDTGRSDSEAIFEFKPSDASERFFAWLRRFQPDAIICDSEEILGLLQRRGIRVPEDLSLALTKVGKLSSDWAGIDQQEEKIGAAAVDLVVQQLAQNQRGIPPTPKTVLIEGKWVDGRTAQPRRA